MKPIVTALLVFLPLSVLAVNNNHQLASVSLARDGEGGRTPSIFLNKELKEKFSMFSRDLKSKYEYTVALSLLKLENGKATIKGSIGKSQIFEEKDGGVIFFTETIKIEETTIPVNERKVIELQYLSDIVNIQNSFPVTLGLVVLDLPDIPKAKL